MVETCHAQRDGDCTWQGCPQLRDNEPETTGRHCPLDQIPDDNLLLRRSRVRRELTICRRGVTGEDLISVMGECR